MMINALKVIYTIHSLIFLMPRSLGGPTGLFSKALRDAGKKISVSSLKGMGLRDDR